MTIPYEKPGFDKKAFNCPFCNAYSNFLWSHINVSVPGGQTTIRYKAAQCSRCEQWTMWSQVPKGIGPRGQLWVGNLVHPSTLTSPLPHKDLPDLCKSEYEEARHVLSYSPRAAAALLRLCIQNLCRELGGKGKNINTDIGELVKNGLDSRIQKALDVVRVTGNNAVHPGTMELTDNQDLVNKLFKLVNLVVEVMITKPKELEELYGKLPEKAREGITNRDGQKTE